MQTELDDPTSPRTGAAETAADAPRSGDLTAPGAPADGATHEGTATVPPSPRPAWNDPLALGVAALVLLPAVAAIASALRNPYAPTDDWALMELQVRAVGGADTPLVGSWSRFGWDHPGPWALWLLAAGYRLVPAEHGLLFAAGMINLVALAACVAMALRRPRAQALVVLVGLALLVRGLGVAGIGDPWNPILPIVPFALFCLACIELAVAPRRWLLAVAVGAGSLAIQAHIGFVQPVVLVGAVTASLVWWRTRRAPDVSAGAATAGRWRFAWPALLVFAGAWFPVALDQVAGQGNVGRIVRWIGGDDLGVGEAVINEGRLGPDRVVRSAAWLLEPFGLWVGRYRQPSAFGLDLLGASPPVLLVWVPLAVAVALLLARRVPARDRWPTVCGAAVGAAAALAVVTDLVTAKGSPVSWPFRWAAVPVMLVWVAVGWGVVGLVGDAVGRTVGTADRAASRWRDHAARWAPRGLVAALGLATAVVVGLTVWRGSVGVQPRQSASEAMVALTPAIEAAARDEELVVANSAIQLDTIDLGLPVVLERAGIEWVERGDPRGASHHAYSVSDARVLDGVIGLMVSIGEIEVVARTGGPGGDGSVRDLVFLRWPPADEPVAIPPETGMK